MKRILLKGHLHVRFCSPTLKCSAILNGLIMEKCVLSACPQKIISRAVASLKIERYPTFENCDGAGLFLSKSHGTVNSDYEIGRVNNPSKRSNNCKCADLLSMAKLFLLNYWQSGTISWSIFPKNISSLNHKY